MAEAKANRTVPMQVLALGLSRSGTSSMRAALSQLGYDNVYHGFTMSQRPGDTTKWEELMHRKYDGSGSASITRDDLDNILHDVGAVTDMPCAAFWRELMDAYPEAKIVLVERDVDRWYRSFDAIVINGLFSWKSIILVRMMKMGLAENFSNYFLQPLFLHVFRAHDKAEMAKNAKRVYKEHYAAIRAYASEHGRSVLEYELGSGWAPLCKYLGKDVPVSAFPNVNDLEQTASMIRTVQNRMLRQLFMRNLKYVAAVGAGVILGLGRMPAYRITSRDYITSAAVLMSSVVFSASIVFNTEPDLKLRQRYVVGTAISLSSAIFGVAMLSQNDKALGLLSIAFNW